MLLNALEGLFTLGGPMESFSYLLDGLEKFLAPVRCLGEKAIEGCYPARERLYLPN